MQRTCNRVRVKVKTRVMVMARARVRVSFRLGLGLRNAQRVWSNAQIEQMASLTWFLFSNFTEHVEILSNVGLHVDPYISANKFVHWRAGWFGYPVVAKFMQLSFCLKAFSCLACIASATFRIRLTMDIAYVCKQGQWRFWGFHLGGTGVATLSSGGHTANRAELPGM